MVQIDPKTHCPHLGMDSSACSETLCEVPGVEMDVASEWSRMLLNYDTSLTVALDTLNDNLKNLELTNNWQYADYCPLEKKYVKIQIPGTGKILSLTEVQIIWAKAIAVTASSTDFTRYHSLIINGVINVAWQGGDVTHTNVEADPWVMIELAPGGSVEEIFVFGRTDCCTERMNGAVATVIRGKILLIQVPK
jgi:hypothetical protein